MAIHSSILAWPGESHGQRSLVGRSPLGRKESDTTERLSSHTGRHLPSKKRKPPPGLGTTLLCHPSHNNNSFVSCCLI